jgi:hypothetical protein
MARRKDNLKYRYGITEEDYEKLLVKQKHSCKICGYKPDKDQTQPDNCQTQPDKDQTQPDKPLYVDHCHQTKAVRGLLCSKCNLALGHMNDDPTRLERAADYLRNVVA